MSDYPAAVRDYVRTLGPSAIDAPCLQLDQDLCVTRWWGAVERYDLDWLEAGVPAPRFAPYLAHPDSDHPTLLRFVNVGKDRAVHVHILPVEGGWYAWLEPADEALRHTVEMQQRMNEVILLNERQQRLVDALVAARSELELRRDEAVEANRLKSEFISRLSHEFRTPLTSILGYSELLSEDQAGENGGSEKINRDWVSAIHRSAAHLLGLVDQILDQGSADAGQLAIQPRVTNIRALIDDLTAIMAPLAAEKEISFAAFVSQDTPSLLWLDDLRLRQVLINLVGNAVKFTLQGHVHVSIDLLENMLSIEVDDTGPGIEEADRKRIFQAFQRAGAPGANVPGVGLGLAITAAIVEAMGGILELSSDPGTGSHFAVRLPAPSVAPPELEVEAAATDARVSKSARLLVAEDDPDIVRLLEHCLSRAGHDVTVVGSGADALQFGLSELPDMIILDVNMPVLDGLEATRRLRVGGFSGPILILTASLSGRHRAFALEAGATDYLSKPVKLPELLATVDRLLAGD